MTNTLTTISNLFQTLPLMRDASASGNLTVLKSLLGPAWRGMVQQLGKSAPNTQMPVSYPVHFDWHYLRDRPQLARLYAAAKDSQWHPQKDLDWSQQVDPLSDEVPLLPWDFLPVYGLKQFCLFLRACEAEGKGRTAPRHHLVAALAIPPWGTGRALRCLPGDRSGAVARRKALRQHPGGR